MFSGSIPALITPFRDGSVDEKSFIEFVNWQIEQGTHGLVPVGTTGESPTVTHEEHRRVVQICVETAAGRVPVMAGAGSNSTAEAITLAKFAEDVGAQGVLCVSPYYNKPSQEGLFQHFTAIARSMSLPVFVYNIPGRAVVDIQPATLARMRAECANIVGVKDATGDVGRVSLQRQIVGEDFIQLSGEDMTAIGFNAHGGTGCISVTANIAPALCAQMQAATLQGDYAKALQIQDRLAPLHKALFIEPNPSGVKYAAEKLGICSSEMRLPMVSVPENVAAILDAALEHAGLI